MSASGEFAKSGALDSIVEAFRDATTTWQPGLLSIALSLFGLLAVIDTAWEGIQLVLKHAETSEILASVVQRALLIGFFIFLMTNYSDISQQVIDSFRMAAERATGVHAMHPSDIMNAGIKLSTRITESMSAWHPADATFLGLGGVAIAIVYALMAAFMILALVESYIVTGAAVLLLAFAGTRWTREYALNTLKYTVSVGAKLFVIGLIVGIGDKLTQNWVQQAGNSSSGMSAGDIVGLLGCSVVMLALIKSVPDIVSGLVNGAHIGNGGALTGMISQLATYAAGAATGGAALAVATAHANQLATAQGAGASGGLKGMMNVAGATMKNLATAGSEELGARFHGQEVGKGTRTQNVAGRLLEARQKLEAEQKAEKAKSKDSGESGKSETVAAGTPAGGGSGGVIRPAGGGEAAAGTPPSGSSSGGGGNNAA